VFEQESRLPGLISNQLYPSTEPLISTDPSKTQVMSPWQGYPSKYNCLVWEIGRLWLASQR